MYDSAWALAVARTRGLLIDEADAAELAASVAPTLERFGQLSGALGEDDEMYEFRRLLAAEAHHP